ncbi:MAG: hypothetical protein WDZ62_02570 [Candidatus Pacearchaeota archaeon]
MIKEEDISGIRQLVSTLEEFYLKLKDSYEKKDVEKFNKIKGELIKTQKEILSRVNS